jgi:preprotein translocase subunit SecF
MGLAGRMFRGETNFDFIGRRKIWYRLSAALLLVSIVSLVFRGFDLSVDFTGGGVFEFKPAAATTVSEVREVVAEAGVGGEPVVEKIGGGVGSYRVRTKALSPEQVDKVSAAISQRFNVPRDQVNPTSVSPTWGRQITRKALIGLAVFLALVILYISMRFEPKMATASIAAMVHDIVITAGIYSIVGFEVTPSTVIAVLTLLGYSLYDNIVVFDKVRENTVGLAGGSRMDYSTATNLAINQTIMRSFNTTLTSLLPVGSLLFVGVFLLGAGSLKDLSLSLFVGMAAGSYSSIFFATPLLTDMKEREPQFKALKARVAAKQSGARLAPATAGAGGGRTSRPAAVTTTVTPNVRTEATADAETETETAPVRKPGGSNRPAPRPAKPAKRKGGRGGRPSGKKRR